LLAFLERVVYIKIIFHIAILYIGVAKFPAMKNYLLFTILLGLLAACVTPYQPSGFTGGYNQTQLDTNVFKVSFRGNGYTSSHRVNDFSLLRCAELCKENGFAVFIITDNENKVTSSEYTTPSSTTSNYTVNTYGNSTNVTGRSYTSGGTETIHKAGSDNIIICFKEKPNQISESTIIYNADFIIKSIKRKYQLR
jgi:hypothetical protein